MMSYLTKKLKTTFQKLGYCFLIIFSFSFQFCNQKPENEFDKKNIKREINILLNNPVETLDPPEILYTTDWQVATNIYESLVAFDKNDKIVPELADSFFISEDKLQYTFYLRNDVYFQDSPCFPNGTGRRLTSYDIKYTFERLANPQNNFPNWPMLSKVIQGINKFHHGSEDSISGIIIKDSLTISFVLTKPFKPFLKILASPNYFIVPNEAVEYFGTEFKYHPVGTGPFRISEFRKYKKVQLVKNENYYLIDSNNVKLPYINSICYTTIKKTENILDKFINNSTDIIKLDNKNFHKIQKSKLFKRKYKAIAIDKGNTVRFWGFNFGKENSVNKLVRLAIAKSFNRDIIFKESSINKRAESLVPSYLLKNKKIEWYKFSGSVPKYNFSKKIKNDTITILSNVVYNDLPELEKAITGIGLHYKRIIKPGNYYRNIKKIKPDLFRVNMLPSYPDPIEYYSLFYSKSSDDVNLCKFHNKEYDRIYEKILYESSDSILSDYYNQLENILKQEIAAIYLSHQGATYFLLPKNLKGINFKYIQMDFRKVYFK